MAFLLDHWLDLLLFLCYLLLEHASDLLNVRYIVSIDVQVEVVRTGLSSFGIDLL